MNEQIKSSIYGQLLNEHRRLFNMITEIKGRNPELTKEDSILVKRLEQQQVEVMKKINRLLS